MGPLWVLVLATIAGRSRMPKMQATLEADLLVWRLDLLGLDLRFLTGNSLSRKVMVKSISAPVARVVGAVWLGIDRTLEAEGAVHEWVDLYHNDSLSALYMLV
jgi:hypothetical protein